MIGPRVSIITVVRNDRDGFLRTSDSVLSQDYASFEYLVVDGASTDGTADLVLARAESLAAWVSEPDQGVYDAMNKGWRMATGDWVLFLNAGDVLLDASRISVAMAAAGPGVDAVYGDADFVMTDGTRHRIPAGRPEDLPRGPFCSHQSLFMRRAWIERLGGFRLEEWPASDYGLIARAHAAGCRWEATGAPLVVYALGGLSDRQASRGHLVAWGISREVFGRSFYRDLGWAYQIFRDLVREGLRKAGLARLVLWYQTIMVRARSTGF
jgi:glycosyltransferase involved in cell wall biosynthesis